MILNPRQFSRYLKTDILKPHLSGWGVLVLGLCIFLLAGFPLLAPRGVSLDLPQGGLQAQRLPLAGSDILIVDGSLIIYRGELLSQSAFAQKITEEPRPDRLTIMASASTTLNQILPLVDAANSARIAHVNFVVKP